MDIMGINATGIHHEPDDEDIGRRAAHGERDAALQSFLDGVGEERKMRRGKDLRNSRSSQARRRRGLKSRGGRVLWTW